MQVSHCLLLISDLSSSPYAIAQHVLSVVPYGHDQRGQSTAHGEFGPDVWHV